MRVLGSLSRVHGRSRSPRDAELIDDLIATAVVTGLFVLLILIGMGAAILVRSASEWISPELPQLVRSSSHAN